MTTPNGPPPNQGSSVQPPPMQVVMKGWWTLRSYDAQQADLEFLREQREKLKSQGDASLRQALLASMLRERILLHQARGDTWLRILKYLVGALALACWLLLAYMSRA